ncbi:hypothetical protein BDR06DRAFT_1025725 [Suillus hirtellus]|nr:hypothetical protein BDR06DRAFT_1025725 [Suillus hirtellus]
MLDWESRRATCLMHDRVIVEREEGGWFSLTNLAMCWEVKEGSREGLVILIRLVIERRVGGEPVDTVIIIRCARLKNSFDSHRPETIDFDHPNIAEPLPLGDGPERLILARQAFLATLPLPADIPDDALNPIVIPQPYILHEFLGNTSGTLKSSLSNYRVLGQPTTYWCPEREEHGYLLTPVFKCSANPRVTTAHQWTVADVIGTMDRPTECFYNKDGKWYYAGVYKAFRMDDLTTEEWEALSIENLYETGQLYAVGALRVACIGLQCVGFSSAMYRAVLEQAALGKWRGIGWSVPTTISSSDTTIEGDGIPGP